MMKRVWLCMLLLAALLAAAVPACAQDGEEKEEAPYTGIIGKNMDVYAYASDEATVLGRVETGTIVDVYEKMRTYTKIDYEGRIGYVLTKFTERVQRKDPFEGPMPGTSSYIAVGRATRDMTFKPEEYRYAINVREGAYVAVKELEGGRAYFEYMRLDEDMSVPADGLELTYFVPWDEAQPGDLLYAFSTYYSVSRSEDNLGRMHNIDLAAERLCGTVVQPDEVFSFNAVCGPYNKDNGYELAPILSGESDTGYGGGTCQVCTTLYNVVLRVPTFIEEMHWHSQGGVKYVPSGFDATVGSQWDMQFRNILPYAVRLEFDATEGVMTAFMYRSEE